MKSLFLKAVYLRCKTLFLLAALFIISLFNSGCTSLSFMSLPSTATPIEIHYSSPDRISFQGKGAGAGIALMASMGPVGIALGVAIDEGIAKDIRENAVAGNVDFKVMLKDRVAEIESLKGACRIEVKKYGFVIKDGSKDYVAAEIHLKIVDDEDKEGDVVLSSWARQQATENWVTLDGVKTKPESIAMLFSFALK